MQHPGYVAAEWEIGSEEKVVCAEDMFFESPFDILYDTRAESIFLCHVKELWIVAPRSYRLFKTIERE
jgi:hypothetical protein